MSKIITEDDINLVVDEFIEDIQRQAALASKIKDALSELRGLIAQKYPNAIFRVTYNLSDPFGVHLIPQVDVEDTEEVLDACIDRLIQLQSDERLPVYVFPERLPNYRKEFEEGVADEVAAEDLLLKK